MKNFKISEDTKKEIRDLAVTMAITFAGGVLTRIVAKKAISLMDDVKKYVEEKTPEEEIAALFED